MKNAKWVGLLAAVSLPLFTNAQDSVSPRPNNAPQTAGTAAVPANISPGAAEVIRLAESGVGDDVVVAYIQNSQELFDLRADDVLYLRDVGLSSPVIAAMLNHDATLRNEAPPSYPNPVPTAPVQEPPPPETEPPPDYTSTPPPEVNYFYNDLSPYGTWVDLAGVGWCWQPRVVLVNHGWRPYCDNGHWLNSDAGWYWQSDYSWGWAPFHYGRWQLHDRCGWVWTPDTTWGPSWVIWRTSGDYCGWAPVPPHAVFDAGFGWRYNGVRVGLNSDFGLRPDRFTFVAFKDFTHHDLDHRHLAGAEVTRVYSHATVVNNYTMNNRTVVNRGIPVDRIAAATRTEIHKVAIQDAATISGRTATSVTRMENGTAVVYRPQLHRPAMPIRVVAQKVDDRHPVIQHPAITVQNSRTRAYTAPRSTVESSRPAPRSEIERRSTGPNQSVPRTYPQTAPGSPNRYGGDIHTSPRPDKPAVDSFRTPPPQSSLGTRERVPRVYSPKGYERAAESRPMARPEAPSQSAPPSVPASGRGSRNGY